ncbi:MAG: DUF1838 family protein [Rhodospirillaceae bacterium]
MTLTRRQALAGAASAATAVATTSHTATASTNKIDFSDPQQKLDAYVRMRNRGDGKKSYTRYSGTFFAKIEGEVAIPIMGIEGMSWGRCERQPDGSYLYSMQEAGYHTTLDTRDVLDEWVNPMNGLTVIPAHYRSGQSSVFTPTAVNPILSSRPEGLVYKGVITPATVIGDTVWCSEDLFVKFPNPRERYDDEREWSGPFRTSTSLATHMALIADLENAESDFVPSTMSYTTINSWRGWMKMGQTPGVISWRLKGRKFKSPDHMDREDWLLRRIESDHPELLDA